MRLAFSGANPDGRAVRIYTDAVGQEFVVQFFEGDYYLCNEDYTVEYWNVAYNTALHWLDKGGKTIDGEGAR